MAGGDPHAKPVARSSALGRARRAPGRRELGFARLALRAGVARGALGGADGHALPTIRCARRCRPRDPARRARRARGPRSARRVDELQSTSLGQLEQPHAVRDGGLRAARRARPPRRARARTRRAAPRRRAPPRPAESCSRATFSTSASRSESRSSAVADERGHGRQPGLPRRPPAALAGDQLEAAGRARAHDDRLEQALRAHRRSARPAAASRLEAAPRLARVRVDRRRRAARRAPGSPAPPISTSRPLARGRACRC